MVIMGAIILGIVVIGLAVYRFFLPALAYLISWYFWGGKE